MFTKIMLIRLKKKQSLVYNENLAQSFVQSMKFFRLKQHRLPTQQSFVEQRRAISQFNH